MIKQYPDIIPCYCGMNMHAFIFVQHRCNANSSVVYISLLLFYSPARSVTSSAPNSSRGQSSVGPRGKRDASARHSTGGISSSSSSSLTPRRKERAGAAATLRRTGGHARNPSLESISELQQNSQSAGSEGSAGVSDQSLPSRNSVAGSKQDSSSIMRKEPVTKSDDALMALHSTQRATNLNPKQTLPPSSRRISIGGSSTSGSVLADLASVTLDSSSASFITANAGNETARTWATNSFTGTVAGCSAALPAGESSGTVSNSSSLAPSPHAPHDMPAPGSRSVTTTPSTARTFSFSSYAGEEGTGTVPGVSAGAALGGHAGLASAIDDNDGLGGEGTSPEEEKTEDETRQRRNKNTASQRRLHAKESARELDEMLNLEAFSGFKTQPIHRHHHHHHLHQDQHQHHQHHHHHHRQTVAAASQGGSSSAPSMLPPLSPRRGDTGHPPLSPRRATSPYSLPQQGSSANSSSFNSSSNNSASLPTTSNNSSNNNIAAAAPATAAHDEGSAPHLSRRRSGASSQLSGERSVGMDGYTCENLESGAPRKSLSPSASASPSQSPSLLEGETNNANTVKASSAEGYHQQKHQQKHGSSPGLRRKSAPGPGTVAASMGVSDVMGGGVSLRGVTALALTPTPSAPIPVSDDGSLVGSSHSYVQTSKQSQPQTRTSQSTHPRSTSLQQQQRRQQTWSTGSVRSTRGALSPSLRAEVRGGPRRRDRMSTASSRLRAAASEVQLRRMALSQSPPKLRCKDHRVAMAAAAAVASSVVIATAAAASARSRSHSPAVSHTAEHRQALSRSSSRDDWRERGGGGQERSEVGIRSEYDETLTDKQNDNIRSTATCAPADQYAVRADEPDSELYKEGKSADGSGSGVPPSLNAQPSTIRPPQKLGSNGSPGTPRGSEKSHTSTADRGVGGLGLGAGAGVDGMEAYSEITYTDLGGFANGSFDESDRLSLNESMSIASSASSLPSLRNVSLLIGSFKYAPACVSPYFTPMCHGSFKYAPACVSPYFTPMCHGCSFSLLDFFY